MRAAAVLSGLIVLLPPAAGGETPAPAPAAIVDCQVAGYDVLIYNRGEVALAAGTAIDWEVRFARAAGRHVLEAELVPGRFALLVGALENYLGTRTPCVARLG
ncbi:MAG: hypothetical protein IT545_13595 [Rhodobacteraceae bacterium]|nr:hypothetical protein [Paracoccaceae bacterium]